MPFAFRCVFTPIFLPLTTPRFRRQSALASYRSAPQFCRFPPLFPFPASLSPHCQPAAKILLQFILLAASISMETFQNHGNYLNRARHVQNCCIRPLALPLFSFCLMLPSLDPLSPLWNGQVICRSQPAWRINCMYCLCDKVGSCIDWASMFDPFPHTCGCPCCILCLCTLCRNHDMIMAKCLMPRPALLLHYLPWARPSKRSSSMPVSQTSDSSPGMRPDDVNRSKTELTVCLGVKSQQDAPDSGWRYCRCFAVGLPTKFRL